jgi:chromosome partition protein MukB
MSRARIVALALVNWKGVFYERYLLDRHVTALEGANGAGKTTVMIAAYVVLLPDMSRLRFTNVGETGATGGDRGIWGRLGELGRPSYAVLELAAEGQERLIAGVRLTRANEPTVEPTPFLVSGLKDSVRLVDVLLARREDGDHVPELDEIKTAVGANGGSVEVFRTTKDYFAALFERGITPLRLASEEDRAKLNEMLRTSMTGGISRALTSELRGFLLKEETGLADTLSRMRANLEACRRTRSEVAESRLLEREISAIYEAGSAMFGAAVGAARAACAEGAARVAAARATLFDAERSRAAFERELAELTSQNGSLEARLDATRANLEKAVAERDRHSRASAVAARLSELDREIEMLADAERRAASDEESATGARAAATGERTRAIEDYDRAAVGLLHLQSGLDELVRRAHAHRQLGRSLTEARSLLDRPELSLEGAKAVRTELEAERDRLELLRAELERDLRNLDARRAEHALATRALAELPAVQEGSPHARARAALARLADREAALVRMHDLDREIADTAKLAERQLAARALASELSVASEPGSVVRALAEAEQEPREQASLRDAAERSDAASEARLAILHNEREALERRGDRWTAASAAVARIAHLGPAPATRSELAALRDGLTEEHIAHAARRTELDAAREDARRRAVALERSAADLHPELLRLRDELGGELLASRFEDLGLEAASFVEARLGPLSAALIVDDPEAAARAIADKERILPSVWLVGAGTELSLSLPENAEIDAKDVVSPESFGFRVTRRSEHPTLGQRARERTIADLHASVDRIGAELDALAERVLQLLGERRDLDGLDEVFDAWLAGDPAKDRARIESEISTLARAQEDRRGAVHDAEGRAVRGRARVDRLRRLLSDSALLGPPDYPQRLAELTSRRAELDGARAELARVADARRILAEHIDVLRNPPPEDGTLAESTDRARAAGEQLARIARALAALEDVLANAHAVSWDDAEAALAAQSGLAPALEAQHAAARAAVHTADGAVAAAEAAWETALAATRQAGAERVAAEVTRARVAQELAAIGGAPAASLDSLGDAVSTARARVDELDREARAALTRRALTEERLEREARAVGDADARLAAAARDADPAEAAWVEFRGLAEAERLMQAMPMGRPPSHDSMQLAADARSQREILLDRVGRARGGDELANALRSLDLDARGHLSGWSLVRAWLSRRVPVHVAEGDDPLRALERLRDHLGMLEGRLARQEGDLRGASEDVARGIDVQLRRAHGQVRRLNQQLEGIRFGSVQGIRVEMRRVERMEQILRALRKGEAQELLFSSAIPIEEALDEIFRRYGGGGRSGGQRLLDYREYVEIVVEIRRQNAGAAWEPASPTRLSTGEAIGVGAALMMVVLTEWERDANLLRPRRTNGSLRFLFLDEANRLSRDNLGVLFDLCRTLDLQLLIAAPEVARAEGNTTYRLVRHVTDDGREEVIVSGRRAMPLEERPA